MKHLLCIIFALVVTIQGTAATISDGKKELPIGIQDGALVISKLTWIIDDKSVRIVPTEVTDGGN